MPAERHPVAIVTGAAGGIGQALSRRLASLGYRLVLVDRDEIALDVLRSELPEIGPNKPRLVSFDVSDATAWGELADTLRGDGLRVAMLVHAAGRLLVGELTECQPDDLRNLVETNLTGTLLGAREIGPLLAEHAGEPAPLPRGMLCVASIFAAVSPPRFAAYNATKAGVVALGETLHAEWASRGLNVTTVLPGVTPTGLFNAAVYSEPRLRDQVARRVGAAELTTDAVAEAAIETYRRRRIVAPIGRRAGRFHWLKRWFPNRVLKRVAREAAREFDG